MKREFLVQFLVFFIVDEHSLILFHTTLTKNQVKLKVYQPLKCTYTSDTYQGRLFLTLIVFYTTLMD